MQGFIESARREFELYRGMAERAMARVDDTGFFATPGPETNSIAILVKHLGGNLRSRWTDFLTTDGEKPDRDRDSEFELRAEDTRADLMRRWDEGWRRAFAALDALTDADASRTVMIRWEAHTVLQAVLRQLTHAALHTGQIVLLARHYARDWESLSIPRGESKAFNERARAAGATSTAEQAPGA